MVGAGDETSNLAENNSFVANIGDTIGVFMGIHTEANLTGAGDTGTDVTTGMELLAGEAVPALIEYPYAPGLVYDPNQNITFIKDWFAIPGPVTWYDANELVQSFTYTTGRVTYSDWRLPVTIDETGTSVGEIGHLNTHYFITESFSGPFMNLLPNGLYWTAPRFDRDPMLDVAYAYTFDSDFGPAQWSSLLDNMYYVVPVFDGPPREYWCPADFDSDGIVDLKDFATFASYWLSERP
ncbi:MAG: DUF1566 domain-containing protein [Planctomycetales bacterium]|nr:DUF1566 domain-containing protein [Planctomycetales bacterium]